MSNYDQGHRYPVAEDSYYQRNAVFNGRPQTFSSQEEGDDEAEERSWGSSSLSTPHSPPRYPRVPAGGDAVIPRIEFEPSYSPPDVQTPSSTNQTPLHSRLSPQEENNQPIQSSQDAAASSLGASIRAGGAGGLSGIAGIAAAAATQQGKPLNLTNLALAAQTNARKRPATRAQAAGARPQRALLCLSLRNPLRKMCIGIVEWKYPLALFLFLHRYRKSPPYTYL